MSFSLIPFAATLVVSSTAPSSPGARPATSPEFSSPACMVVISVEFMKGSCVVVVDDVVVGGGGWSCARATTATNIRPARITSAERFEAMFELSGGDGGDAVLWCELH